MKYYLWVLGCQMNVSDSERIACVLENLDYQKTTSEKEADLIMVVACSVRQSAVDRIYGKTKYWRKLRTQNSELRTILTGCVLEEDRKKLEKNFDIIFDIKDLAKLPDLIVQSSKFKVQSSNYFKIKPKYKSSFSAFVPISTGCNNFCSYCVVPYVRGREVSRPAEEIIIEARSLVSSGYKEITLLGQNVNSYGQDSSEPRAQSPELTFSELLKKINNLLGKFWIRFLTSHPKDMSDELIKTIAECKKVTPYIHLPFQAGNNEILRKMNRKYTKEDYLNLVSDLRSLIPDLCLSTDIIVGFPTETKEQFQDTVDVMEKIKFDMAYIAQYSPRFDTAATKFKDNVSKQEKKRRKKVLTKILEKTALENNKKYVGKEVKVLVDSVQSSEPRAQSPEQKVQSKLSGRTKTFKSVRFYGQKSLIGQFVKVKITDCNPWGLEGKIVR